VGEEGGERREGRGEFRRERIGGRRKREEEEERREVEMRGRGGDG
jgi:hypothetical protein